MFAPPALGWRRDLPDFRDRFVHHDEMKSLLAGLRRVRGPRPASASLEEFFPPTEDQGGLAAGPALAASAMVEYFERRAHGRSFAGSWLFLYKMARRLLHWQGDSGAPMRETIKALKRFGLPPRQFWPADPERFDEEPAAFLFAYARDYQLLSYLRLDPPGAEGRLTLTTIKAFVAAGFPVAFGFTAFDSMSAAPEVPFPSCFDAALGGQAVVAVGYDDALRVRSEKGALRVRNAWGSEWGDAGYGWLPYRYVTDHLAADFWTLLRPDWLASGELILPVGM
jgi:C1A family cysteine protease